MNLIISYGFKVQTYSSVKYKEERAYIDADNRWLARGEEPIAPLISS